MAFLEVKIYSEALGMQTSVNVIIPERGGDPAGPGFKCLYLLHGLSDDETIWMRRTSVERYADRYGICVVMPRADKSFYTDMKYGPRYYTYVAKELPCIIRNMFRVSARREDNFVAGLSMGGYGALKIALRESDAFCAGAGLSSAVDTEWWAVNIPEIYGEKPQIPPQDDLLRLAEAKSCDENRPKLFVAVGTEDGLLEQNRRLKAVLEKYNYNLVYRESPGNHNWEFWDEYIQYVLEWLFN